MSEQIDFRWHYQPCNEHDERLMQYIQNNQIRSKTEMLLLALRSFWLPHALVKDCSGSKEQMRPTAHSAVQALTRQSKDILELVGLEETPQTIQSPIATSLPSSKTPHSSMFSFYWRYQPRNERDVQLMRYIQNNQIRSKTEMLLLALRSFWLPYALVKDCSGSKEQMRPTAHSAVQALTRQSKDILGLVGLEETPQTIQSPIATSLPSSKTPHSNTLSLDDLRHLAGDNDYDDTALVNFL